MRSEWTLEQLAREINPVVRGSLNYYGRFFPSTLVSSLNRINDYLVRWLVQKYKRFRRRWMRARDALGKHASVYPRALRPLEAHQALTANDWTMGVV